MNKKRLGKCYELAAHELLERGDGIRLVHGTINGHAWGVKSGVDHAWLECQGTEGMRYTGGRWEPLEDVWCWEPATETTLPKEAFEQLFGAEAQRVYTKEEASKLMCKTGHYGPWEEEL